MSVKGAVTRPVGDALDLTFNVVTHVMTRDDRELLRSLRRARQTLRGMSVLRGPRATDPEWIRAMLRSRLEEDLHSLQSLANAIGGRLTSWRATTSDASRDLEAVRTLWVELSDCLKSGEQEGFEGSSRWTGQLANAVATHAEGRLGQLRGQTDTIRFREEIPWAVGETWKDEACLEHYVRRFTSSWRLNPREQQALRSMATRRMTSRVELKRQIVRSALYSALGRVRRRQKVRIERIWVKRESGEVLVGGENPRARFERHMRERLSRAKKPALVHVFHDLAPEDSWQRFRAVVLDEAKGYLASEVLDVVTIEQHVVSSPLQDAAAQEAALPEVLDDAAAEEALADLTEVMLVASPQQRRILLAKADPGLASRLRRAWGEQMTPDDLAMLAEPCDSWSDVGRVLGIPAHQVRGQVRRLRQKLGRRPGRRTTTPT